MDIVFKTYKISKKLPDDEKFGLVSQINRCAVSIPSNIAEGSSRNSQKEYKHFLEIALGSAFELETQFLIIKELYLNDDHNLLNILSSLVEEQKMINTLIEKIKSANS